MVAPSSGWFIPTHHVGAAGARTWPHADPASPSGPPLEPGLPVQVVTQHGGWAQVRCSDGWETWTDATALEVAGGNGWVPEDGWNTRWRGSAVLLGAGAVVLAVGTLLPWARGTSADALDLPAVFLVDPETTSTSGFSIGAILLLVVAAIAAVTTRGANGRAGLVWPSVVGFAVIGLYGVSVHRVASPLDVRATELFGYGVYVSAAGCLIALAGALGHPRN